MDGVFHWVLRQVGEDYNQEKAPGTGARDFVKDGNLKVGRKAAKKMPNNYPPRSLTASLPLKNAGGFRGLFRARAVK